MGVIAGCSSGSGNDETPAADDDARSTVTTAPKPPIDDLIGDALGAIRLAATLFAGEIEKLDQSLTYPDFETRPIRGQLSTARDTLTEVQRADDGDREGVDTLLEVVAWLSLLVEGLEAYAAGLVNAETSEAFLAANRIEAAVDDLEAAEASFRSAVDTLSVAARRYAEIDVRPLEGLVEDPLIDIQRGLDEIAADADTLSTFAETFVAFVPGASEYVLGKKSYDEGLEAFNEGEFAKSVDLMGAAQPRLESAQDSLSVAESVAPRELLTVVLTVACQADRFARAAGLFARAAQTVIDDGPQAAASHFNEWREVHAAAEAC